MTNTNIPPAIHRLQVASWLHWFLGGQGSADHPVSTMKIRDLHAAALGPGRRKRTGVFELRDERDVYDWLRLNELTLFVPSSEAALRSMVEDRRLDKPPIGKRYSVYAMLSGDQMVALVQHRTEVGEQIVGGLVELPYDAECQVIAAGLADPQARVRSAAVLDMHAALNLTIPTVER